MDFRDCRSMKVVLVPHCALNQNSRLAKCAERPSAVHELVEGLMQRRIGILQMPCPELMVLGRGQALGTWQEARGLATSYQWRHEARRIADCRFRIWDLAVAIRQVQGRLASAVKSKIGSRKSKIVRIRRLLRRRSSRSGCTLPGRPGGWCRWGRCAAWRR
jgi:hypothetical protein